MRCLLKVDLPEFLAPHTRIMGQRSKSPVDKDQTLIVHNFTHFSRKKTKQRFTKDLLKQDLMTKVKCIMFKHTVHSLATLIATPVPKRPIHTKIISELFQSPVSQNRYVYFQYPYQLHETNNTSASVTTPFLMLRLQVFLM